MRRADLPAAAFLGVRGGSSGLLALLVAMTPAPAGAQPEAGTECSAPRIAVVRIVRHDVFPAEEATSWLPRLANALHIETRESVVRRELLFAEGERVDAEALAQTERNLRAELYLSSARVEVLSMQGEPLAEAVALTDPAAFCVLLADRDQVQVRVTTRDSWSTSIDGMLRRAGNRTIWGVGIEETNLLGHGKRIALARRGDVDRDSRSVTLHDPRLGGSRLELLTEIADQSDGSRFLLQIGRPFFSLDAEWGYAARLITFDQFQPLYEAGERVRELRHVRRYQEMEVARLLRRGDSSALRFHLAYRRLHDDVEVERRDFGFIQAGVSSVEHRFLKLAYLNHERPVDVNLGAESGLWVGLSSRPLGGSGALLLAARHRRGVALGERRFLLAAAVWEGRVQGGEVRNGLVDTAVAYVDAHSSRQVLLASGRLRHGISLDPERQIKLGADNGLRGYVVNQWTGDRSLLLGLEHRWFLLDDFLRFASLGAAAFVDSGTVWPRQESIALADLHTNVGVSLLVGRKRMSTRRAGMRIDLAYALRPVEGRGRWLLSFGSTTGILPDMPFLLGEVR